ncbi:MAG TPA: hypothetical protein VGM79_00280 [Streptosporangiaceae bacterium]
MTSRVAVRPVAGRGRPPAGLRPFSVVDELNCYLDSAAEPNNVHLEVWLPGQLSPSGLRAAVTAALAGSPQARARRAAGAWWRSRYAWECPPEPDVDPVSVVAWQDQAELDSARAQFLAATPPLDRAPLFRLLLARGPGRDSLILNAHHAAFDGRSCLSLLSLIAEHYGGLPPQPGAADSADTARPLPLSPARQEPVPADRPLPAARGPALTRPPASRLPLQRTARIASQHAHGPLPRRRAGHGVSLLGWPDVPAAPQPDVTVNDLLIAALIQAVAGWNAARRRWSGRVRITMPVDTRPSGQGGEIGNLARLCTVTVDPRAAADLTAAVAGQTAQAKDHHGPAVGPVPAAVARARLPAPVKRWMLRLATRSLGRVGCDTSLLSNLGNVADPPRFGTLSPTRLWFSTSAHMPRGLSLGAVTVDGRLQLCLRYRNALLDEAAARDFAAEYGAALSALAGPRARR